MAHLRITVPEIGQDVRNYTNALTGVGLEPVVISVQTKHLQDSAQQEYLDVRDFTVSSYDGLLLPGGVDINPACYGEENAGSILINDDLDRLQMDILEAFVHASRPVLGICRGLQLINVYFGGTLIQNLDTSFRHAWTDNPVNHDNRHPSRAANGSWLSHLYGITFATNSAHHQAVREIAQELTVDARCSEDGVVEALHHQSLPIFAVQFHPERMSFAHRRNDTVDGEPVFTFFRNVCEKMKVRNDEAEEAAIGFQI